MRIISTHIGLALLIFAVGYAMTAKESTNSAMSEEAWVLSPVRLFKSGNSYLRRLTESHRWKINPKIGRLVADNTADVSQMKLVGVVSGVPTYALVEISGIVHAFQEGQVVLPDSQILLVEINKDGIRLADMDREFELMLYPGREND